MVFLYVIPTVCIAHPLLIHAAILSNPAAEVEDKIKDPKLLGNQALLWLLKAALSSLRGNNVVSTEQKHITRRRQ